jgi:ABC-type multidrug transport system ATPase subunit
MFEQMDEVREFMGVCPQHDVLFDLLTPREHLDIFYDFKGGEPRLK